MNEKKYIEIQHHLPKTKADNNYSEFLSSTEAIMRGRGELGSEREILVWILRKICGHGQRISW